MSRYDVIGAAAAGAAPITAARQSKCGAAMTHRDVERGSAANQQPQGARLVEEEVYLLRELAIACRAAAFALFLKSTLSLPRTAGVGKSASVAAQLRPQLESAREG